MKRLLTIVAAALCLLSACQTSPAPPPEVERPDSAAIYHQMAWREMFADSLSEAEDHAYRAFMLSRDSALECGSLSLLCYIYYREGKQQELQLLMQTVSPDTYVGVMDVQMRAEQARAGHERWGFALVVALLLLLTGAVGYWYVRRVKSLARLYQQRVARVRRDMREALEQLAEASVEEVSGVQAHDSVESQATCPPSSPAPSVGEAKAGIDVLHAIISDQNISQMGRREEQAVVRILPLVDAALAAALAQSSSPLTPKETFFCIMEYYGKDDRQKARSFCCSEQAVRSTKSRLGKKMDISRLHSE